MSAVNLDLFRYLWLGLLTRCNSKGDSISRQSSMDLFRYNWIHLLAAIIAKKDGVSHKST